MRKITLCFLTLALLLAGCRTKGNGFTAAVKSTMMAGQSIYVTVGLAAPEKMDLSGFLETEERLSFRNLTAQPASAVLPAKVSYQLAEDGDGRANTLNVIFRIDPVTDGTAAIAPGEKCTLSFDGIVKWGYDKAYEQELIFGKYAGQTGYALTPEESEKLHPQQLLASGKWTLDIVFSADSRQTLEFLTDTAVVSVPVTRHGATEMEIFEAQESVTLTSIQLTPLDLTISFEPPKPLESFDCLWMGEDVWVQLRDGNKISFFQSDGAKNTAVLLPEQPISLADVQALHLADGTEFSPQ